MTRTSIGAQARRQLVASLFVAFLLPAVPATRAEEPAESAAKRDPGGETAAPLARTAPAAEPSIRPPLTPSSPSSALERALARFQAQPVPEGEVYALVRMTDRETGQQLVFSRGTADLNLGLYVDDPQAAPDGRIYSESDAALAIDGVEVVVRAVHAAEAGPGEDAPAPSAADEEELDLRQRNAGSGISFRIEEGLRRVLAARPDGASGTERIPVVVSLKGIPDLKLPKAADPAAGGLLWAGLDAAMERERRIIDRKRLTAAAQAPVLEAIRLAGGEIHYAAWMSGSIQARVPAAAIPLLAEHPRVFSLEYDEPQVAFTHRFMGDDIFVATNSEDYDAFHSGFHGLSSKHSYTSRVTIAMSEECIDVNSPAWRTGGPGSGSRALFYDIDPSGYTLGGLEACWTSNDPSHGGHAEHRHGHWVAGTMVGDFMDGQEPGTGAVERRRMTGTCPECKLVYFQDQNLNNRHESYDRACDFGADIYQSSIGGGISCDGEGGSDSQIQDLVNCDVVYVQSAGNNGEPPCETSAGWCTTGYPADHPWTFAVSGMQTEDPCDDESEYYTSTCRHDSCASRGGADYDGCDRCATLVDLTGPYRVSHGLQPGSANPTTRQNLTGTSFASPIVAGLMAELMDWYRQHISTSIFYDNRMRNFMLLMGDRSADPDGIDRWLNDTDRRWGAGRVGLVPFDDLGCWHVFRGSVSLGRNKSYSWNLDLGDCLRLFKAVAWHDGKNYANEPMIRLTLNPSGCSTPTESVDRLDSKTLQKMQLNGCTGMTITVKNIGVGVSGSRRFHVAAYGTNGTTERTF